MSGTGRARHAQLQTLLEAVQAVTKVKPPADAPRAAARAAPFVRRHVRVAAALALLAVAAIFALWQNLAPGSSVPIVAVTGADKSPRAAAMAHDLLVKLGSLRTARADAVQLTEHATAADTDLTFAVGASSDGQISRASLVIFDGRTRDLLWSKDFELPSRQQTDLQQQVAFTAGRALECALEALAGEAKGLTRPVLKLYLNGCAMIDEIAYADMRQLVPTFCEVTAQAPKFEGGWAKLIQAEVLAAVNTPSRDPAQMAALTKHIAEARKINPHLAEAYLAEVELVAPTDHEARLRLTELATQHAPEHPEPFAARAYYLRFVGRMNDAVESAKRASELNPLAPTIRNDYISALMNAGQLDRARHELERAERLWPGATAVREIRFVLQLRYGDPSDALRMFRAGATSGPSHLTESFLQARINPTRQNVDAAVQQALAHYKRDSASFLVLAQTLGAFNREHELFSILLERAEPVTERTDVLFRPDLRELRRDPRFMRVANRAGLVAYWRKTGHWADFCFEPDLPYDCKEEAVKLS